MPEVGGDAVIYIISFSVDPISEAMISIYESFEIRKNLIEKGSTQLKKFSWDRSAKFLWESIISTLES
jgi:glycosyltransferase involved in cell wall biosynthesis